MDDQPQPRSAEAEALLRLAATGAYDDLEAAWMAAIEADALSADEAVAVLRAAAAREGGPRAGAGHLESLAWFLLSDWTDRKGPEPALAAARAVADVLPASAALRREIAALYRRCRPDHPHVEALAEMVLGDAAASLADAIRRLDAALALPPGTYVRDPRRRSPGRVVGLDAGRRGLEVAFGESRKVYDPAALDALERLEPDDFGALAAFEPDRAAALAWDDAAALVRLVLRAYGPRLSLQDLRARLEPVVPPADWSRWWKAARPLVKRDARIEMTEGARPDLVLRSRPMAFEDQVRRDFEALGSAEARLEFVLEHLAEPVRDSAAEAAVLTYLGEYLEAEAAGADPASPGRGPASPRRSPAAALGARAVLAAVRRRAAQAAGAQAAGGTDAPAPPAGLPDAPAVAAILQNIRSDALVRTILAHVREAAPGRWPEVYAAALAACSPGAAEWVAGELAADGHHDRLREAVAAVLARPVASAGALVWVWRAAGGDRPGLALSPADRCAAATGLLQAADDLKRTRAPGDDAAGRLLSDVQRALAAKEYASLRRVLGEAGEDQARALRVLAGRNAGLTDLARIRLLEVIRETHPALHAEKPPDPWEEDAVYTTEDALHARQKEFEDLVHVQMVRNSEAIGRAAARGDLSENAEFTAALEERDRLTERANRMQEDLVKARLIRRSLAEADHVTVGSRVLARDLATGRTETLVFLGPWEAAPERGIYYYRTALGQAFMGKKVGETAVLRAGPQDRRWEVLQTGPAL